MNDKHKLEEIKKICEEIYFADDVDDPEEIFPWVLGDILEIIYGKKIAVIEAEHDAARKAE